MTVLYSLCCIALLGVLSGTFVGMMFYDIFSNGVAVSHGSDFGSDFKNGIGLGFTIIMFLSIVALFIVFLHSLRTGIKWFRTVPKQA